MHRPAAVRLRSGKVGVAVPPLTDHHVHLTLLDDADLAAGGLAAVVDLGGDPARLTSLLARTGRLAVSGVGAFLTAPGGYPAGRAWAPAGSVVELEGVEGATTAVAAQTASGAAAIKVTLHAGGPVLDAEVLGVVVAAAHRAGLPVVAHAEGPGMADRALRADVDVLAHTPWTDRLDGDLVSLAAARQVWISTLDIHGYGEGGPSYDIAVDNLRRFAASGGRVLYGTDLGNGPLPIGVNIREILGLIRAGLTVDQVITAMTDPWPHAAPGLASFLPGPVPADVDGLPAWLASARTIGTDEVEV